MMSLEIKGSLEDTFWLTLICLGSLNQMISWSCYWSHTISKIVTLTLLEQLDHLLNLNALSVSERRDKLQFVGFNIKHPREILS